MGKRTANRFLFRSKHRQFALLRKVSSRESRTAVATELRLPPQTSTNLETLLNKLTNILMCASFALAAGSALAMDDMKKGDTMAKDSMTMQQCKDHMAMAKKDGMKKDDAMMKRDTMCTNMMKTDGMMKNGSGSAMQPDNMASGAMKK